MVFNLAQKNYTSFPDVVISSSALKSIFNNFMPQLDEVWSVPVVVRAHGNKNVIYIDKSLPPTSMSTEEKTQLRCKRGTRVKLATSWEFKRSRKQQQQKKPSSPKKAFVDRDAPPAEGGLFNDTVDLSQLETFGMDDSKEMPQVLLKDIFSY
jgi:hypothetical protein